MKTARQWFDEYGVHHQNVWNRRIHVVAVPLIMVSLIALLWQVPIPFVPWSKWANFGTVLIAGAFSFYVTMRSLFVLVTMGIAAAASVAAVLWVHSLDMPWWGEVVLWSAVFALCWVAQFIGHGVFEGKKPSFLKDLLFLFVGPAWVFAEVLGRVRHTPPATS